MYLKKTNKTNSIQLYVFYKKRALDLRTNPGKLKVKEQKKYFMQIVTKREERD